MRGAPRKAIQELLGHATIQMTMRYAHLSPDVSRQALRLLDHQGGGAATWQQNPKTAGGAPYPPVIKIETGRKRTGIEPAVLPLARSTVGFEGRAAHQPRMRFRGDGGMAGAR